MKDVLKIVGVLTAVCVICALALSFVFGLAKEKIEANTIKRIEDAIRLLAPSFKRYDEIKLGQGQLIYKLFDERNELVGYGFLAQGQGYQGKIGILTVLGPSLEVLSGIEIIESVETPGLGAKIANDDFKEQFKNLTVLPRLECVKERKEKNQVKAITGATVSSRAVVNILNSEIARVRGSLSK